MVSIPERVLEALKLDKNLAESIEEFVSIPERVLEALKLLMSKTIATLFTGYVSIPERVLEALKQQHRQRSSQNQKVSIPERVLEALKPKKVGCQQHKTEFQSLKGF